MSHAEGERRFDRVIRRRHAVGSSIDARSRTHLLPVRPKLTAWIILIELLQVGVGLTLIFVVDVSGSVAVIGADASTARQHAAHCNCQSLESGCRAHICSFLRFAQRRPWHGNSPSASGNHPYASRGSRIPSMVTAYRSLR